MLGCSAVVSLMPTRRQLCRQVLLSHEKAFMKLRLFRYFQKGEMEMRAIRIHEIGGPEVMHLEEIETPTPKEGEVLVKVAAAGINYADIAQCQGTYLTRTRPPMTLGGEVAGTVAALGPGVSTPAEGTRVVAFGT